jgi:hypothetical protein
MEVSGQLHNPATLPLGESALGTNCIGDWLDPRVVWTLWRREKSLAPTRNQTPTPQPSISYPIHYTN